MQNAVATENVYGLSLFATTPFFLLPDWMKVKLNNGPERSVNTTGFLLCLKLGFLGQISLTTTIFYLFIFYLDSSQAVSQTVSGGHVANAVFVTAAPTKTPQENARRREAEKCKSSGRTVIILSNL